MFRNPRENSRAVLQVPITPSSGRPPTPPDGVRKSSATTNTMMERTEPTKSLLSTRSSPLSTRVINKNNDLSRRSNVKKSGSGGKPNGSILTFFKKVDEPPKTIDDDDGLFVSERSSNSTINTVTPVTQPLCSSCDMEGDGSNVDNGNATGDKYNELGGSVKKRKLSGRTSSESDHSTAEHPGPADSNSSFTIPPMSNECSPPPHFVTAKKSSSKMIGPFIDDSDSEDESSDGINSEVDPKKDKSIQDAAVRAEQIETDIAITEQSADENSLVSMHPIDQVEVKHNVPKVPEIESVVPISENQNRDNCTALPTVPSFKQEETSYDYGGFDDMEDFPDDDDPAEGEEFVERKWMEEQARLEAAENGFSEPFEENMTPSCPICEGNLSDLAENEASRHVNACLDGNPIPIPQPQAVKAEPTELKMMPPGAEARARFSRAAIARPGQANPFELGSSEITQSSAFSKLMSSHAEDAAWANAAAAENAARGKPAYKRTCPFYKIMPGFFICVDAFRYGAVQGCNAYFLSHFHSDHYIGLTSTWCHGPIYCSKVTANLVKQQLRVDPKWVVALDFETKIEVPGTQSVAVTMIPANHCPGSSLYLFEKIIGKGANPKIQRVLHCGDFRACPAHIEHPLLMPDIVDSFSGRTKQQKIDVCYLDTTYLNPKYAFPCQEDVIKACADMCVSLSKDRAEEADAWEVVKKERAGAGMAKFVGTVVKPEDSIAMEVGSTKTRGKLLIICGTYSIGKERICMGIARALDCKIWAAPGKQRICAALEDPELAARMTDDPREAQIHMQMLMEIRAETLQDYLNGFKPHFSRIVGFRPSGWNYKPPNSRFVESPSVQTVLTSDNWKSRYSMAELVPQRGSTREASCFGVPYSEHSSFRELTMFCCALRIEKVIPTVNVGSAASRAKMKTWIDRWLAERRKTGIVKIGHGTGEVRW